MLSPNEVQHIAKLARISLSDEEILRFQKDLGSILEYVDILREVDAPDIALVPHAPQSQNIVRQDIARAKSIQESQLLLAMAPSIHNGYLKVKSIL